MIRSVVIGCALALVACGGDVSSPQGEPSPAPSHAAGPKLVDQAGVAAALAERKGSPVLLNFWAMWCPPCVAELPDLMAGTEAFRANGGEVLLVAMDLTARGQDRDAVAARIPGFLGERGIELPCVLYDDPDPLALTDVYDLGGGIPETLAFDGEGRIVDRHRGRGSRSDFERLAASAAR